ncbi:unnamed protein product, partial [Brassica oleracea var. botrytis]
RLHLQNISKGNQRVNPQQKPAHFESETIQKHQNSRITN